MSVESPIHSTRPQVKSNLSLPPIMAEPTIAPPPVVCCPIHLPSKVPNHVLIVQA